MTDDAPFGAFAPPAWALALRRAAQRLGPGRLGRWARSAVARAMGARRPGRAFDVEVLDGQRARLTPVGNLCEKRVLAGDRWWEREERDFLARAAAAGAGTFAFMDVGANVGLYTLAARAAARAAARPFRAVAVEPQPEMLRRLRFNLAASGAAAEVVVLPWAATGAAGVVRLGLDAENAGRARVGAGEVEARAETLLACAEAGGLPRIDAMKLDIEGGEEAALGPFLRDAPRALWPAAVVLEARPWAPPTPAMALLLDRGWTIAGRTRMNALLRLEAPR